MNARPFLLISTLVAGAQIAFAFITAGRFPAGTQLPIHWNAAGQPDNFAPALEALLMPAGVTIFVALIFAVIPRIEPLQHKLEGSAPVLKATWAGMLMLGVLISLAVGLPAYDIAIPIDVIPIGVGLLFVVLGNALPKSRPGFFVGIRTPWAIIDTDNWIATHRLGGRLMMLAGVAIVLVGLLPMNPEIASATMIGAIGSVVVIPFAYSWWLWKTKNDASSKRSSE